jgi:hypothetical protein
MAGKIDQLTKKQQIFVREYLLSLNASDAYRKAGYSQKNADVNAARMLVNDRVAAAIAEEMEKRAAKLQIEADDVLRRLWIEATADRRELTEHRIGSCRYCWGFEYHYQWKTEREYRQAVEQWRLLPEKAREIAQRPTDDGGYGYRLARPHNPECPECDGLGRPFTVFADTSTMSPEAAAIFGGVKETKDGKQFVIADRSRALELVGKHLGMFKDLSEVTGKNGGPIEHSVKAKIVKVPAKEAAVVTTRDLMVDEDDEVEP